VAGDENNDVRTPLKPRPDRIDFYEKSVDRFSSWVQFEDAKAGAVLVFLGLGLTDVLGNADTLINAHEKSTSGAIASIAFWVSIFAAVMAVGFVAYAVWPFTRSPDGDSIYFFKDVAARDHSLAEYVEDVNSRDDPRLEEDMANQAWTLARIAAVKVKYVTRGFWSVTVFLVAWAVARIALGLG
jgi:hypothetical protein